MLLSLCKMLLQFISKSVLSMLSFRNFMIFILTLRCLIYFCTWCEKTFYFILIYVAVQFFHHWLLKNCLSSIAYSCLLCYRLIDHKCVGLFLKFLSCSIDQCICCCVSIMLFQFLWLCSIGWSQIARLLQLYFSFSSLFWLLEVFSASIQSLKISVLCLLKMFGYISKESKILICEGP